MIRRSFFQVLSGLFLPLSTPKAAASLSPVSSAAVALLAALARSRAATTSTLSSAQALATGATESPHIRDATTPHASDSSHGPAAPITENGGHRSTSPRLASNPDPEWLREWQRIPRLEVREDDLPHHHDQHQRNLAAMVLRHIRGGTPFVFRYLGGSSPGEIRRVLPTSLFCLDLISHFQFLMCASGEIPEPADGPLYLLAWCQHRNAPRTFRLDRIMPLPRRPLET